MFPLRLNVTSERKSPLNINTMTQITLSLYILSLRFRRLYENETSSQGPKKKKLAFMTKKMKFLKKAGVKINIFKSRVWVF